MTKVELKGIRKSFDGTEVIKGVDLLIEKGEFFTFLGPSGCGKSTLLNIVAGLEEPTTGRIYFDDRDVTDLPPPQRDVAMVFQSYALYPHMSVFENIAFPLRVRKESHHVVEEEVRKVAALVGLERHLAKRPSQLSGGERQRVALGRAIVRRPRVFLMDEPLSNLDARLRIIMRTELKRLHRELSITTIYVTHDQEEAMSLSDRVAVFHGGRIQQCGPAIELYRRPANLFVARFIGSPPMNIMEARLVSRRPPVVDVKGIRVELARDIEFKDRMLAGIRPEDVELSSTPSPSMVEAVVDVAEPLGVYQLVEIVYNGSRLMVRTELEDIRAGQRVYFKLIPERIHLFDPQTERRL